MINKEQLKMVLEEIEVLEKEYPKCRVVFDRELDCIQVIKPLPQDYYNQDNLRWVMN
ncbi:MAG: hypothetical protein GY849_23395 [Deltaproteobacteria bacterium]|nr:hypothetical protein [Deltaproteobacteria bacterium]